MRRRKFITLLGGVAATWPLTARAQSSDQTRLIGVLMASRQNDAISEARLTEFRNGLAKLGWTEGRNIRFEVRHAGGDRDMARASAAELVKLVPDVIFSYGTLSIAALKAATQSVPIVFVVVNDPVAQGYVPNMQRPGGNITGFSFIDYSMIGKALGFFKQMAPAVTRVGFLFNPDDYPITRFISAHSRSSVRLSRSISRRCMFISTPSLTRPLPRSRPYRAAA
jgi:putative ABC transport system substrate-binding protein